MYRLGDEEVRRIGSFSIDAYLRAFEEHAMKVGERAVISVFAGGPKVQAIAAAPLLAQIKGFRSKLGFPRVTSEETCSKMAATTCFAWSI